MALNFLKRKKNSYNNVLLNNNPNIKSKTKYEFSTCMGKDSKLLVSDIPDKPVSKILRKQTIKEPVESRNIESNEEEFNLHNEILGSLDDKSIEEQNWDRGKERIDKLMHEISDLLSSENYDKKRYRTMTESQVNKESPSNQQGSSEKPVSEQFSSEKKQERKKLPLDIQELHNVAAMAKRLKARSKIQNHSD